MSLMGKASLSVQQRDAPVHLQQRGGQLLVPIGDNARYLRLLAAVHHPIHDEGDEIQRRHRVQTMAQVAEGDDMHHHNQSVQQAAQRAVFLPDGGRSGVLAVWNQASDKIGKHG